MKHKQYYVLATRGDYRRDVLLLDAEPTEESHGKEYAYSIGAFKTRRGANYMAKYGRFNPNCQTVEDAERLAAASPL